ncbi:MAG: polysaccharide deacetylase family protein [Alphaproteobacteria bacterium]|nr:polysaccharide deacetylase family protein [Alphaproteobacteria bacterium]NNF23260.1 polysaccharide deacetylase family protein [Paracoccaceae bacterium]
MTTPAPGMDHGHYRFSAIPSRKPTVWPGGARMAVTVLLHLEYWELEPPRDAIRDNRFTGEYGFYFPEFRPFTQREYGNRIGIFRVLDLLEGTPFRITVAANSMALERYPELVERLKARGCEFAAHGEAQTRMLSSGMSQDEERSAIARVTDAFEAHLGARPAGWLGPDSGESARTPQLLAEAGYRYLLDWPNDDQPYSMTTKPPLVSVPNQMEWDDVTALWLRKVPTSRYPDLVGEAAKRLAGEGGRSFVVSLHPWVIGQPHRVKHLRAALGRLAALDGLWHATAGEMAEHMRALWGWR